MMGIVSDIISSSACIEGPACCGSGRESLVIGTWPEFTFRQLTGPVSIRRQWSDNRVTRNLASFTAIPGPRRRCVVMRNKKVLLSDHGPGSVTLIFQSPKPKPAWLIDTQTKRSKVGAKMKTLIFHLYSLFFLVVNFTFSQQKTSRLIFNEFSNLTDEQTLIMAFNYTQQLFSPDR